jgi:hypothetical protein
MSVGYPRPEDDYVFAPLAVFFRLPVCLGLYPSDLPDPLRGALGRKYLP